MTASGRQLVAVEFEAEGRQALRVGPQRYVGGPFEDQPRMRVVRIGRWVRCASKSGRNEGRFEDPPDIVRKCAAAWAQADGRVVEVARCPGCERTGLRGESRTLQRRRETWQRPSVLHFPDLYAGEVQ